MSVYKNNGKLWTPEDDQAIISAPQLTNEYFSEKMFRTDTAIQFRRVHLAARLHQQHPEFSIHDCLRRFCGTNFTVGDIQHASTLLAQWRQRELNFSSMLQSTQNGASLTNAMPPPFATVSVMSKTPGECVKHSEGGDSDGTRGIYTTQMHSLIPRQETPRGLAAPAHLDRPFHHEPLHVKLQTVMTAIKDENGKIENLWNDPDLSPYIALYYPGLEKYATFVVQKLVSNM